MTSINGCDSIIESYLLINPTYYVSDSIELCNGDSLFAGGAYQTTAGLYLDTLTSSNGCDSIIESIVSVINFVSLYDTLSICAGDSIFLGGAYVYITGDYVDTISVLGSCDSIVNTNLTVYPVSIDTVTITACEEFITSTNDTLISSGIYHDTLSSVHGCDSVIIYDLTINQQSVVSISESPVPSSISLIPSLSLSRSSISGIPSPSMSLQYIVKSIIIKLSQPTMFTKVSV